MPLPQTIFANMGTRGPIRGLIRPEKKPAMDRNSSSTKGQAQRLIELIQQVDEDCRKVAVWAGALVRFAAPVLVYAPGDWSASLVAARAAVPAG